MKRMMLMAAVLGLLGATAAAVAGEAEIKRALEARYPRIKVDKITKTPYSGLYEVVIGTDIVYSDENGDYLIDGRVIDTRKGLDLTEKRVMELTAIPWSELPLDQAVKTVRGNGKRVLAVFSDPHCPYCKRLDAMLVDAKDTTIYTFLYPIIHPELRAHSEAIWCSKDPSQAYFDLALKGTLPKAAQSCPTPIDKNVALGRKLKVNSTPTLFFKDGRRLMGVPAPDKLAAILDETSR